MLNNIGPSTLPCGTPLVTVCHPEKESPTFTLCVVPLGSLQTRRRRCYEDRKLSISQVEEDVESYRELSTHL